MGSALTEYVTGRRGGHRMQVQRLSAYLAVVVAVHGREGLW